MLSSAEWARGETGLLIEESFTVVKTKGLLIGTRVIIEVERRI